MKKQIKGIKAVKHQSVVDEVISQLENVLKEGTYTEGEKLPNELELCEAFSVGRTTIREALRVMEAKGLVVRSRKGTYVKKVVQGNDTSSLMAYSDIIKKARLKDLFEARRALEIEIAGLAALNATEEDLENLQEILHNMKTYKDNNKQFIENDAKFHTYLGEACGNQVLNYLVTELYEMLVEAIEELTSKDYHLTEGAINAHTKIIEAIQGGSTSDARKAMLNHLETLYERINDSDDRG